MILTQSSIKPTNCKLFLDLMQILYQGVKVFRNENELTKQLEEQLKDVRGRILSYVGL